MWVKLYCETCDFVVWTTDLFAGEIRCDTCFIIAQREAEG